MVQHFMFGPGWAQGCPSCSYMADHTDGMAVHLAQRDLAFVAVSRAPLADIERFRQRMGWRFRWVSSNGSDFNHDYHVSFTPEERAQGEVYYNYRRSRFPGRRGARHQRLLKNDAGEIFHTYSTYGRGVEVMMGTYSLLDLTPKGRNERRCGQQDGVGAAPRPLRAGDRGEQRRADSCCAHGSARPVSPSEPGERVDVRRRVRHDGPLFRTAFIVILIRLPPSTPAWRRERTVRCSDSE